MITMADAAQWPDKGRGGNAANGSFELLRVFLARAVWPMLAWRLKYAFGLLQKIDLMIEFFSQNQKWQIF